ncbi:MAG: hypothetical protein ACYCW6_28305, partial [Candidatus Xenobia bacterium]
MDVVAPEMAGMRPDSIYYTASQHDPVWQLCHEYINPYFQLVRPITHISALDKLSAFSHQPSAQGEEGLRIVEAGTCCG